MVVTTNKHRVTTPTNNKDSMVLNNPDMEVMDITNKDTDNSNKAMVSNSKDKMVNKAMDNSNKDKMVNRAMDSKDMDNSRARTTRDTVNNKDNNSKDNSNKLWEIIINKETPVMVQ